MSSSTKFILAVLVVVLVVAAIFYDLSRLNTAATTPPGAVACTMEAKLCPDGSYVGREGPNCEFAQCPNAPAPTTGTIKMGQHANINGTDISILSLTEDSRCPVDVQCIQAGTVRVRTAINSYSVDFTFTLGVPKIVGNATIALVSVIPAEKHSKVTVSPNDYLFTFSVVPVDTAGTGTYNSGVRGTVSLGPTCPVVRDPPDPACADAGYATTISAYHPGSTVLIASTQSAADGTYSISLPPGSYTVSASGGTTLPRCSSVNATVTATGYTTADISCDTGIR